MRKILGMAINVDKQGNISIPNFLNIEKWAEIRKKNKVKVMLWETVKLAIPLTAAVDAASIRDVVDYGVPSVHHMIEASFFAFFLSFIFVFVNWHCMEKNWLYLQNKLQEKFLGN